MCATGGAGAAAAAFAPRRWHLVQASFARTAVLSWAWARVGPPLPGLQVGQDKTVYGAQNSRGLLFFEGLFLAFRCLFSSLFVFPQEHKMMVRGRSGPVGHRVVPACSCALLAGLARPGASSHDLSRVDDIPSEALPLRLGLLPAAQGAQQRHVPPVRLLPGPHRLGHPL